MCSNTNWKLKHLNTETTSWETAMMKLVQINLYHNKKMVAVPC